MRWIIGIDEVGRGALAGPVVVAAAAVPRGMSFRNRSLGRLKDSKKLSAAQREAWTEHFNNRPKISFALARVYPRQIEHRNISQAANLAAKRAFLRLSAGLSRSSRGAKTVIFLDGGLYLGRKGENPKAKTIIKGDEKINAIKVASIIAKVHRDRLMRRLSKKYPVYDFIKHKGYGTKMHRAAIASNGPCPVHRLTFIRKSFIMEK